MNSIFLLRSTHFNDRSRSNSLLLHCYNTREISYHVDVRSAYCITKLVCSFRSFKINASISCIQHWWGNIEANHTIERLMCIPVGRLRYAFVRVDPNSFSACKL